MATRYERVVLDLEDRFSSPVLRAAAAAGTLDKALDNLDTSNTRVSESSTEASKSVTDLGDSNERVGSQSVAASREIDRMSGRLRLLADVAAILGPGLIPIAAVGIPAVAGLAAQFGAAAVAGGTMVAAFQGVGTALEAVNKAQLEPTAENLEKARLAMQQLGPDARDLVRQLQEMRPALLALRDAAAAGLFPGLERSLFKLEDSMPRLEHILNEVGHAAGFVAEEFADGIAGPRGQEFLRFIQHEVPDALVDMGRTVGNLVGGLAELWMAFTPVNRDFSDWLLDAARSFDDWASGLAKTQGFQEFVDYLRNNGPRVADALVSVGDALLQIVEAAAPLGGPVLEALTAVADVVAAIAGSNAGPAIMATVTALALLSRGMKGFQAISSTTWAQNIRSAETFGARVSAIRPGRLAGALAGLAVAGTGVADSFGLANAASGALLGSIAGPWGAAVGGAVGLLMDLAGANDNAAEHVRELSETLNQQTGAITAATRAKIVDTLETDGILRDAQEMGLSLKTVTDAALGSRDALAELEAIQRAALIPQLPGEPMSPLLEGIDLTKGSLDDLIGKLKDESGALGQSRAETRRKAAAMGEAAGAADKFTSSEDRATSAVQRFRAEVERTNRLLEKRSSLRDYEAAVDDFTKSLPKQSVLDRIISPNGRINTDLEKGREVQERLDAIAATANKLKDQFRGTERVRFLQQARQDMIDAAKKLGLTQKQAEAAADYLGLLDRKRARPKIDLQDVEAQRGLDTTAAKLNDIDNQTSRPSIEVNAGGAIRIMDLVAQQMRYLDGLTSTTYVETIRRNRVSGGVQEYAYGGTVPGPRYPYRDQVLALLAPGEEVISNRRGEADRFRADRAAGRIPAYADGGQVAAMNRAATHTSSHSRTVERVVETLPRGRVVARVEGFGDVALRFVRDQARGEIDADRAYHQRLEGAPR